MSPTVQYDKDTAVKVAEFLEHNGMLRPAADTWLGLCADNPYDRRAREKLGDLKFQVQESNYALGSVARSRFILRVMGVSFPTGRLREAYFENLDQVLKSRPKRATPGAIVLGVGSGRCGSTTLAAALAGVSDACATHENPPMIFWQPIEEQLEVHFERFRRLADRFALVFDAASWWLNALERFFAEFPQAKVIGLYRDTAACVQSFMKIKGSGRGSLNHWAAPGNGIWTTSPGDPMYPSYAVPTALVNNPDAAKAVLIERYVTEYNQKLHEAAAKYGQRMLLLRTEELGEPATIARLSAFLGVSLSMPPAAMNVGGTTDSDKLEMTF
jgi:hypothetical protein